MYVQDEQAAVRILDHHQQLFGIPQPIQSKQMPNIKGTGKLKDPAMCKVSLWSEVEAPSSGGQHKQCGAASFA